MKTKLFLPFRFLGMIFRFIHKVLRLFIDQVYESIRLQLILTFVFCLLASLLVFAVSNSILDQYNKEVVIDYSSGKYAIDRTARSLIYEINQYQDNRIDDMHPTEEQYDSGSASTGGASPATTDSFPGPNPVIRGQEGSSAANAERQQMSEGEWLQSLIARTDSNYKILILDLEGAVLYKSSNATESHVDIHNIIRNAMETRINTDVPLSEFSSFYPISLHDMKAYLVVSGVPQPQLVPVDKENPLAYLIAIAAFIILFYFITKRKMQYIEELAGGLLEISKGSLDYRVRRRSRDELGSLAGNINVMTEELQHRIEEDRRAEKIKNELITNVSHDLRTPLTLIMGYLRLLKDKNYESEQQAEHYLGVAYGKSEKLKALIDDLFEFTKLTNQGVKLYREKVCLNELLEQLLEELVTYTEENEMKVIRDFPTEKLFVQVDPDKMIRVFENLLVNAVKYSFKPGEIKVRLWRDAKYVNICMINSGEPLSNEDLSCLFDRFYRAEKSRSSESGGSGLGLAIAKSIIDLHQGEIWAECEGQEIKFCIRLKLSTAADAS